MRQETNNEIDLLLRRLSRRQNGSAPDGDLHADTDHLDADELSSYAENALPTAARARYTEHLAECSRCRELVVQLSSAAGVVVAEQPARVSVLSGVRKFLASLFSPMVLPYAIPALGIIVVAVIGFTLFRSEGRLGNMTARAPDRAQQPAPNPGYVYDSPSQSGPSQPSLSGSPGATADLRGQRKEVQAPPPNAQPSASVAGDVATVAAPVTKTDSEAVANAAAAPPPPKVAETTDIGRLESQAQKKAEEAQKREEERPSAETPEPQKDKAFSQAPAEDKQPQRTASREAKSRRAVTAAAPAAGTEGVASLRDSTDKDRSDGETRSVGGRRFRKQGSVWVDTAYAGGATTDFTRGSDGYRTLVADEPTIKTIADQLDGQIIVVWKGRAYRIR